MFLCPQVRAKPIKTHCQPDIDLSTGTRNASKELSLSISYPVDRYVKHPPAWTGHPTPTGVDGEGEIYLNTSHLHLYTPVLVGLRLSYGTCFLSTGNCPTRSEQQPVRRSDTIQTFVQRAKLNHATKSDLSWLPKGAVALSDEIHRTCQSPTVEFPEPSCQNPLGY